MWFEWDSEANEAKAQDPAIVKEWRRWVRHVIAPNNEEMLKILMANSHLIILEGPSMPSEIGEAVKHFLSYRTLLQEWDEEEAECKADGKEIYRLYSWQNTSTIGFPRGFPGYVDRCWKELIEKRTLLVEDETAPEQTSLAGAAKHALTRLWTYCFGSPATAYQPQAEYRA